MAANLQLDSQQSTALGVAELYIIIKRFRYRSKINRHRFYFSSDAQPKLVGSSGLSLPAICHLFDTFAWIEVKLIFPVVDSFGALSVLFYSTPQTWNRIYGWGLVAIEIKLLNYMQSWDLNLNSNSTPAFFFFFTASRIEQHSFAYSKFIYTHKIMNLAFLSKTI